jgi:hypothetical protein
VTRFGRSSLRQLVLVSTAWREWRLGEDSCRAFDRVVRGLLGPAEGIDGRAWLAETGDGSVRPGQWLSGAPAREELKAFIGRLATAGELADDLSGRAETLGSRRLRVLCDPVRTRAVLPGPPGQEAPPWTALDVRFLPYAGGFRAHLGFTFWAVRPPWRPPEADSETPVIGLDRVTDLRTAFEGYAVKATRNLVDKHFGPATTLVWGREYAPPVFWVATLAKGQHDTPKYLERTDVAERLVRPLLGRGPGDSGVAAGILNGNVLALRLFRQERDERFKEQLAIRPAYLLLPGLHSENGITPKDDSYRQVITSLTEFEARAATDMHDIDDALEVWRTHVQVYDRIARQAARLWDVLALHLPVRSGKLLEDAHRPIALVHQTLLQGVADLADLVSQVESLITEVDELEERLSDLVDERIAERPLSTSRRSIGTSLAQMGQFNRLRRLSSAVAADARRVNEQYKDMLASIAHAFDERRVREVDVLQRVGFYLSLAFGMTTMVTILDFVLNIKSARPLPAPWNLLAGLVAAALAVFLADAGIRAVRMVRHARDISSPEFRDRYEKVLTYLRACSTRELDMLTVATADLSPDDLRRWSELDGELAESLAALWDEATAGRPVPVGDARLPAEDIQRLAKDVEEWTLRALLLTERPRRLWHYRLPKLTLLYRHCVALPQSRRWNAPAAIVADVDLERSLEHNGHTRTEARSIDAYIAGLAGSRDTTERADPARPGEATALLREIERVMDGRTPARELDRVNREYVGRMVRRLVDEGVDQFIDVGTGIPGSDSVHEMAPRARVVYVDSASDAVAQGQALLTEAGRTKVIQADMRHPASVFWAARASGLIRLDRPLAVLFTRVLGHVSDDEAAATVVGFATNLPPGSFIVISHVAPGSLGDGGLEVVAPAGDGPGTERLRGRDQIQRFFEGLDLCPPGVVDVAFPAGVAAADSRGIHLVGGLARVP